MLLVECLMIFLLDTMYPLWNRYPRGRNTWGRGIFQNLKIYVIIFQFLVPHRLLIGKLKMVPGYGSKILNTAILSIQHIGDSLQFSHSAVSDSSWPHELQHARLPCPSPTPGVHPNSHPSSFWCHPTISSSVIPFSSCPQLLPASEALQENWRYQGNFHAKMAQ